MARFVLTTNLKLLVANTLGKCVAMRHVKMRKINLILVLTKIGDVYIYDTRLRETKCDVEAQYEENQQLIQ